MGLVLEYLKEMIARQVKEHHLVVWLDPEESYSSILEALELPGVRIIPYSGSFFALRRAIDPFMVREAPPDLIIYVPLAEEDTHEALVAYTRAGVVLKPGQNPWQRNTRLSLVARNALKAPMGDEAAACIEEQVEAGKLTLRELDSLAEKGKAAGKSAVLSTVFGTDKVMDMTLAFLATARFDAALLEKNAVKEAGELFAGAFGLGALTCYAPEGLRTALSRHILATALLGELRGEIPKTLRSLKAAKEPQHREQCLALAQAWRLRSDLQESYARQAGLVEKELAIDSRAFTLEQITACETFRAVEKALQDRLERSLLAGATAEMVEVGRRRQKGFWAMLDPELKTHWDLIVLSGELLILADSLELALKAEARSAAEIVARYTATENPWCALDTLHRRLEKRYFDFESVGFHRSLEELILAARSRYTTVGGLLAERFTRALEAEEFKLPGVLPQLGIYRHSVLPSLKEGKTAYLLVDAFRYEMALELVGSLSSQYEATITHARASVPTITELGMASLMPHGDEAPELVKGDRHKVALKAGAAVLKDRSSRVKYLKEHAGVPLVEMKMDDLFGGSRTRKKLKDEIASAQLVLVTTKEIDAMGESGNDSLARGVMDVVLFQLRKAVKILADFGVQTFFVTSDHGHLFGEELGSDMKIDPPMGDTVDLHRRAWVGKGGVESPSYLRAPATAFGLAGDLEIAAPYGFGAFKVQGGGGAYFHGGLSLQELIIPLVKITPLNLAEEAMSAKIDWELRPGSRRITTRFFSVTIRGTPEPILELHPPMVRVELRSGSENVSTMISASYGLQNETGDVRLKVSADKSEIEPNTVTLALKGDPGDKTLDVVLTDGVTGVELKRLEKVEVTLAI